MIDPKVVAVPDDVMRDARGCGLIVGGLKIAVLLHRILACDADRFHVPVNALVISLKALRDRLSGRKQMSAGAAPRDRQGFARRIHLSVPIPPVTGGAAGLLDHSRIDSSTDDQHEKANNAHTDHSAAHLSLPIDT